MPFEYDLIIEYFDYTREVMDHYHAFVSFDSKQNPGSLMAWATGHMQSLFDQIAIVSPGKYAPSTTVQALDVSVIGVQET